jgi:hydroxymethylpyrimidine/phosphomethylpyrimidine kinase
MRGRVLIVAGSDSGGGAGIQADIKAVTALEGFAATAITALTAQDTVTVHGVHPIPPDFIARQMAVVLEDIGADAIKTGMLGDAAVINAVADVLSRKAGDVPLVLDPVMVAKGGARLLDPGAIEVLKARLLPLAFVITPNIPEAEALTGRAIVSLNDMEAAAQDLMGLGPSAVLIKGGHGTGAEVTDVLADADGIRHFSSPRLDSRHTHGTGCTLASAIACGLAQGLGLAAATARARAYVVRAIETAPGLGAGHGPLNHGHTVQPFKERN